MGQEKELGKDDSTEVQSPPDPMESCGGCIATLRLLGLRRGLSFYISDMFSHWPWAASSLVQGINYKASLSKGAPVSQGQSSREWGQL